MTVGKILPAPGTNQIAGFVEFRPLTSRKKDRIFNNLNTGIVCSSNTEKKVILFVLPFSVEFTDNGCRTV